jgi:hypothetical protein
MNPGYGICEAFVSEPAADVLVVFEDDYIHWLTYSPPAYASNYPASRFGALIYDVPGLDEANICVDLALARNIGNIYVTDDGSDGDRWDDPPTFFFQVVYHMYQREVSMLVPLYKYPDRESPTLYFWQEVALAAQQIPVMAIINPDEGPGIGGPNNDYQYAMNMLAASDVYMVGYIPADYGNRPLMDIQADIDEYSASWSPWLAGLFIDEVGGCNMSYWRDGIYNYNSTCVTDVPVDPGLEPAADAGATPRFQLSAPHPNPFNPRTVITFRASLPGQAQLAIYDLSGQCLVVLADGSFTPGEHQCQWDGNDAQGRPVASGTYVVRLRTASSVESRKLALLR